MNEEVCSDYQVYEIINGYMENLDTPLISLNLGIEYVSLENQIFREQSSIKTISSQFLEGNTPKKKRQNNKSRCLSQNLASISLTIISKILPSQQQDRKQIKLEMKMIRAQLDQFLTKNKVKNNQLILLFIYLFLKLQSAQALHFRAIRTELMNYLAKRDRQAQNETPEEKDKLKAKIAINRRIIERYFVPQDVQIDAQWIKVVCGEMFTGRQKDTIDKPIEKLLIVQQQLNNQKYKKTQYKVIQSYLEI